MHLAEWVGEGDRGMDSFHKARVQLIVRKYVCVCVSMHAYHGGKERVRGKLQLPLLGQQHSHCAMQHA